MAGEADSGLGRPRFVHFPRRDAHRGCGQYGDPHGADQAKNPVPLQRRPSSLPGICAAPGRKYGQSEAAGPKRTQGGKKEAGEVSKTAAAGGKRFKERIPPGSPRRLSAEKEDEGRQIPGAPLRAGTGRDDGNAGNGGSHFFQTGGRGKNAGGKNRAGIFLGPAAGPGGRRTHLSPQYFPADPGRTEGLPGGEKRGRKNHPAAQNRRGTAGAHRYPRGLYAAKL